MGGLSLALLSVLVGRRGGYVLFGVGHEDAYSDWLKQSTFAKVTVLFGANGVLVCNKMWAIPQVSDTINRETKLLSF